MARASLAVPDEISVVGFDNIFGSDFCTPSLTTVAAPLHALGSTAVQQLVAQIHGAPPHTAAPGLLPAQLVIGESTALPRTAWPLQAAQSG